jgi:DNA-binding Xre family transcriptional regulator
MTNPHIGSSFAEFLNEEGIHDDVTALAVKRTIAWQLDQARIEQGLTKQDLAARMHTSRSQLDRLLDPGNAQIRLDTPKRAADALGRRLVIELV